MRDDHLPPVVEGHLDDLASEPFDRGQFRSWCVVGHDDATRDSESPSVPGDSLRHVPCACGVNALGEQLFAHGSDAWLSYLASEAADEAGEESLDESERRVLLSFSRLCTQARIGAVGASNAMESLQRTIEISGVKL